MTRGKNAKTTRNSRPKNCERCENHLTSFSEEGEKPPAASLGDLQARVVELERQVAVLGERMDRVCGVIPSHFLVSTQGGEKKKPGPAKTVKDPELLENRNRLVGWLEGIWPEIVQPLYATSDPCQVAAILKSVAWPEESQPPWQSRFLRHPDKLVNFLKSEKFKKKPPRKTVVDALGSTLENDRRIRAANRLPTRQIANAMAGVPKLSWRTSSDRCSENPCRYLVTLSTAQHYRAIYDIPDLK